MGTRVIFHYPSLFFIISIVTEIELNPKMSFADNDLVCLIPIINKLQSYEDIYYSGFPLFDQ